MLIVPYFVDEIGGYGLNNTRWIGGVCDLNSCNGESKRCKKDSILERRGILYV